MKTIIGIIVGAALIVCLGTIQKESSQICLTYSNYPFKDMKKDINFYYLKGYRVVSISSYGETGLYAEAILVMEK
jgi:hypothetical protein